jgi:aspartyl/asparaginyl beta-hydroxylase (cupin superfamily)
MKGRQLTDELAGAHLLPHCGSTNARLTAHLPLIVPDGCEIRVGDEVRQYREGEPRLPDGSSARPRSSPRALGSPRVGELLIFDDSYEHEVWNRHPTDVRVVLLIRFWHPDIAPAKYAATKRAMRRAVVRHRRNTCLPPLDVSLTPPS